MKYNVHHGVGGTSCGLMFSVLDCGASGLGLSPGQVNMGNGEFNAGE